jgi:signal transduction histidine kinase
MDIYSLKQEGMEILLFIYGLSFFVLGTSVFFSKPKESEYFFASKIWLLGTFAIVHSSVEWIGSFLYIHPELKGGFISYLQLFLLLLSYIFLFEFSRFIVGKSFKTLNQKEIVILKLCNPVMIYSAVTALLAFLIFLHPTINGINAAIRFTYGFWGSLILGIGLYNYGGSLKKSHNIKKLKLYFKISGVAFVFYAIFAGAIVPKITYFSGNIINTNTFFDIFQIPVQFFRAVCAVVIAVASIKALEIFRYELITKLNESYNKIKKFSQDASHQIKTPLTIVRLQTEITLKKDREVSEYKNTLNAIDKEIISLQNMVNNLLLLTKMEDSSIKNKFEMVEIDAILLEIFEEFLVMAQYKGVVLDIKDLEHLEIQGEPTLLKILFSNLIDNAIKFTPKGKRVTMLLTKSKFIIKDEGLGISKDEIPMVFDKFFRVNILTKDRSKGYGLGLSMVKKIAQIHRLNINIESRLNFGTIVTVEF